MKIQFDEKGFFRIVHPSGATGEWAGFRSLAILVHDGKTYIAGSDFGLLPRSETVFVLSEPMQTNVGDYRRWDENKSYVELLPENEQKEESDWRIRLRSQA